MYFLAHDAPFSCRKAYRKLKDREARQQDIKNQHLSFLMGRDQNRRDGDRTRTDSRSRRGLVTVTVVAEGMAEGVSAAATIVAS